MFTRIVKNKKNKKVYTLTYDEDRVLDTVECEGKLMMSTHHVVKVLVRNADAIFSMDVPNGFERV